MLDNILRSSLGSEGPTPVNHDSEGVCMFVLVNFEPDQPEKRNRLGSFVSFHLPECS